MMRVPLLTSLLITAGLAVVDAGEAVRVTLWAAEVPAGMIADLRAQGFRIINNAVFNGVVDTAHAMRFSVFA